MYRGKGNSDGRPYFTCGTNNAVFVAMDKIVKKCDTSTTSSTITQQPKSAARATAPATRSQTSKRIITRVFDWLPLHGNETLRGNEILTFEVEGGGAGAESTHKSRFKVNDRVILQSAKEEVIAGAVKWVGPIRLSKDMKVDPVSVVGVETVSEVV